jgi:hypothetical protein
MKSFEVFKEYLDAVLPFPVIAGLGCLVAF